VKAKASVTTSWGKTMKRLLLTGVSLAAFGLISGAQAADPGKGPCPYGGDPYKNYNCLDSYLGIGRLQARNFISESHERESAKRLQLASQQTVQLRPMRYYGGPKSPMWRGPNRELGSRKIPKGELHIMG
jgi:hypothetical protein